MNDREYFQLIEDLNLAEKLATAERTAPRATALALVAIGRILLATHEKD